MGKTNAEKSTKKREPEESYSYYSQVEDDDAEAQREEQDRAKDRAKNRGARADRADSISTSDGDSPAFETFQIGKELRRASKNMLQPQAKHRPVDSAGASRKNTGLSCSEPRGAAVAGKKRRHSCSEPSGAAVTRPSSRSAAVAALSSRSAAVAGKRTRLSCSEPSGAAVVNDLEGDFYGCRDVHQNLGGISEHNVIHFRARQTRKGDPNQRDREMKVPISSWMVAKGCEPAEINKRIFDKYASSPHVCVIFVDLADEEPEPSSAFDYLCVLADQTTEHRVSCSDSKNKKFSGPKKKVHRLGREEKTFAFVVIHNGRISRAMYDDHQFFDKDIDDLLRFGTLHVALAPYKNEPRLNMKCYEQTLCIGITSVRQAAGGTTELAISDAQKLARWTRKETHDIVITCTGRNRGGDGFREFWHCFGVESTAKHSCPIYQPLSQSPVAIQVAPQMAFLYGECKKVNWPCRDDIEPFVNICCVDMELLECAVKSTDIPSWLAPPRTDLAHRQGLGEVSVKAIQWKRSSDSVLPLNFFIDHPSKTIVKNDSDDKGKGKDTTSHTEQSIPTDNKGRGKRAPPLTSVYLSTKQTSTPQQPTLPPPRTRSPTPIPRRRPRRPPSPRDQVRPPRTPSHSPGDREVSCSDQTPLSDPVVATTPKSAAVATTNNVSRPVGRLQPNQQSKVALPRPPPSRSPCVQRHTRPRRSGSMSREPPSSSSIAHEPPSSKAEYLVERARKDRAKVEEAGGDKRAAGSDKRSHTEDSNCAEEDDMSSLWEEEEFETKQTETFERPLQLLKHSRESRACLTTASTQR